MAELVDNVSWPGRIAAGVTDAKGTLAASGEPNAPQSLASVTKLLSTMAVLVAIEEGSVSLDQPAPAPAPNGATLIHLLSHSSGLGFDGDQVLAKPGVRRIYSNRGIELAAAMVEAATEMSFGDYLSASVLAPLGLTSTTLDGSPAKGATGTVTDLLALGRELLAPTLISAETLTRATTVVFAGLVGVLPGFGRQDPCDWGLGFELKDHKQPHWTGASNSAATFGHFGQSGSFLWVDPEAGLAAAALSSVDFGPDAAEAWPQFSDAVVGTYTARR